MFRGIDFQQTSTLEYFFSIKTTFWVDLQPGSFVARIQLDTNAGCFGYQVLVTQNRRHKNSKASKGSHR